MDSEDSETLTPLLVEIMNDLPRECITDDKFVEAYSAMRRRPDGKSLGYIHDVVWQLAARFLIVYGVRF